MSRHVRVLALTVLLPILGLAVTGPTVSAQQKKDDKKDPAACVIEVYKDAGGKFRFRIKSGDANLAMASRGYDTKDDVMKVVNTLRQDVAKAKVDDQTAAKSK